MDTGKLDYRVYKTIVLLNKSTDKLSIRKIAKVLGKEKSLYSIQLSVGRLVDDGMLSKDDKGKIKLSYRSNLTLIKNELEDLHK